MDLETHQQRSSSDGRSIPDLSVSIRPRLWPSPLHIIGRTEPPSDSRKRSQSIPSDKYRSPQKRLKSPLEEHISTSQNTSRSSPVPPHTTQKANSKVTEWVDTLQHAEVPQIVGPYSSSDVYSPSEISTISALWNKSENQSENPSDSGSSTGKSFKSSYLSTSWFRSLTLPINSITLLDWYYPIPE
ncbi:hypothetical protein F4774DRAFT_265564 [Daldinia eschscholtzii]|nr:hypothetical protein F4774DRAFT_265564 [Daldinia eschscholtzii]